MLADPRSLNRLAKDTGVDVSALSRFGTGERGVSMKVADALAEALELDYRPIRKRRRHK